MRAANVFSVIAIAAAATVAFGQTPYKGLTPGLSHRADADRALGPATQTQGSDVQFKPGSGTNLLRLRFQGDVILEIHVGLEPPVARTAFVQRYKLSDKPDRSSADQGHLVEYYRAPLINLIYATGDRASGVSEIAFLSTPAATNTAPPQPSTSNTAPPRASPPTPLPPSPLTSTQPIAPQPTIRVPPPPPPLNSTPPSRAGAITPPNTASVQRLPPNLALPPPPNAAPGVPTIIVRPAPTTGVMVSDGFRRADAPPCNLGGLDLGQGGNGSHYYLPINPGSAGPVGAQIVSGALRNNGFDYGGVQVTQFPGACQNQGIRGERFPQDLAIQMNLLVPGSPGRVTEAGPYFRSRAAAAGDGILGGRSTGYWVQLASTGEVRVKSLNPYSTLATTGIPAGFNSAIPHTLEAAVQANRLEVALDGRLLAMFQRGNAVSPVQLPTAYAANDGTVGIAFSAEGNRGQAGGQTVFSWFVSGYHLLGGRPLVVTAPR